MTSLCKGKRVANPNKCKKISACKVASGKKRSFCRTKRNKNNKGKSKTVKRTKKRTRLSESNKLKGYTRKQVRELKKLR